MEKIFTVVFSFFIGMLFVNGQSHLTLKENGTFNSSKASKAVTIYPIPANNFFKVKMPESYKDGKLTIRDIVGKEIKSLIISKQEEKIETEEILSGVYFVSIKYKGERVFTKRIVIDK